MPAMKTTFGFFSAFLALFLAFGCGGGPSTKPLEATPEYPTIPTRIVVTDFKDARDYKREAAYITKVPPLTWSKKYEFTHPDDVYAGSIDPMPALFARNLAEALAEGAQFDQVVYAPAGELPPKGEADVLITGTVKASRAHGRAYFYSLVLPLGFQFSDILWYLGFPKTDRRYDLGAEIDVLDYYTGKPLIEPINVDLTTSSKTFLVYASESKFDDLKTKLVTVWNEAVVQMREDLPTGSETAYWAKQRSEGEEYLAYLAREELRNKQGAIQSFQFLSPAEGAIIRQPKTTVRWSAAIPNGLKALDIEVNNRPIATGVRSADMASEATAPKSLPARDVDVDLAMGANVVTARVVDHRDNVVDATLRFTRYPRQLNPVMRHALLIGTGSPEAQTSVEKLETALADPFGGQFEKSSILTHTGGALSKAQLDQAIRDLGLQAKAGELAVIYIAADGKTADMTIGDGVALDTFIKDLDLAMATDEVVLLLDINWDRRDEGKDVMDALGEVPMRWAVSVSSAYPTPAESKRGQRLFAFALADALTNGTQRLTLERMLDTVADAVETESGKKMEPDISGRYDRNVTMAEFE
ncbi:MAG: hypothetical protein PWP23_596 [Candidatus Sumerlaeota bacterium]|nr:hypothetical protein [Candidatus Sumerlaeota bacterium]